MRRASILATAGLALLSAGAPGRAQQAVDWTVMVYLNGDTVAPDGENISISDFNELEQVGSSARVNVVVQWDRRESTDDLDLTYPTETSQSWTTTRRYLVTADPAQAGLDPDALTPADSGFRIATPVLLDLGEQDMGSEETLVDFVDWSFDRFPAQHYLLVLAGEGGPSGWRPRSRGRALVFDPSPNEGSFITNAELRSALARIKALNGGVNLDALGLDVGRHAIIEELYECRNGADNVFARFLGREADGFPYDDLVARFTAQPPADPTALEALLANFAGDYLNSYNTGSIARGGATSTGIAVVRTNRLEALAGAVDQLAVALLSDLPGFAPGILRALARVQRDDGTNNGLGFNLDLVDFATEIAAEIDDAAVDTAAAAVPAGVLDAMVNTSIRNTVAPFIDLSGFSGVGAYFPAEVANFDTNYSLVTQFVADTSWDELVQGVLTLFSDQNGPLIQITSPPSGSTIIDNPPELVATIIDQEPGGRVNAASIVVSLDGLAVDPGLVSFDSASGLLRFRPATQLGVTSHTYRVEARDLSGNLSTATTNFRIAVANLTAGLQTFSLPRMLAAGETDPALIFGANNFTMARWVASLVGVDKYRYHPDTFASFRPPDATGGGPTVTSPPAGLGYWVRIREPRPISSLPGLAVTAAEYKIRLYRDPDGQPGWNMIGNPYDVSAVGLAAMFVELANGNRITFRQAIANRLTPGVLFTYVPNAANVNAAGRYDFAEAGEGQLSRLKGHWLRANEDFTLVIATGGRAVVEPAAPARPVDGWSFELRASQGELSDGARLGVAPEATRGYDARYDIAAPPALPGGVEVRVTHSDWGVDSGRYIRDLRGPGQTEAWDLSVAGPAGTTTVSWPSLRAVPAELDLVVTDLTSGRTQRMRTTASFTYEHDGGAPRSLRVVAAPRVGTGLQVTGVTVTRGRGSGFDIGYALSAPADVTMTVRSLSGRVLRSLPTTTATAGRSAAYWDGRSADGKPLPNGIYQLDLVAVGTAGEQVRRLVTVRVAR